MGPPAALKPEKVKAKFAVKQLKPGTESLNDLRASNVYSSKDYFKVVNGEQVALSADKMAILRDGLAFAPPGGEPLNPPEGSKPLKELKLKLQIKVEKGGEVKYKCNGTRHGSFTEVVENYIIPCTRKLDGEAKVSVLSNKRDKTAMTIYPEILASSTMASSSSSLLTYDQRVTQQLITHIKQSRESSFYISMDKGGDSDSDPSSDESDNGCVGDAGLACRARRAVPRPRTAAAFIRSHRLGSCVAECRRRGCSA